MDQSHTELRIQTVCLLILTILATAAALRWLRPIMIPFVLALMFSYSLAPVVGFQMRRLRLPHGLAVVGAMFFMLVLLGGVGGIVTASVAQLAENASVYEQQVRKLANRIENALPLERLGLVPEESNGTSNGDTLRFQFDESAPESGLSPLQATPVKPADRPSILDPLAQISGSSVQRFLLATTNAVLNVFSQGFLVFIFMLFIMLGAKPGLETGVSGDGASNKARKGRGVLHEIQAQVKSYLATKVLVSLLTGLLVGLVLAILRVDYAVAFGFMAFVLNFIPNVGSLVATLLPLPVVFLTPEFPIVSAVLAIAIPGAIQFTVGNILEPKLMGQSLDLDPVVILIALIFWGMLWGIIGMLLAVPITAVLKILFERLEHTAPIAHALAGRLDKLGID
ncbi:MAG: AI-2E family transporter [Candidatus Sumerlaeia bacterium]|nr:AI-2E family transporter [Candidatus Sumerlaeia bacterium]